MSHSRNKKQSNHHLQPRQSSNPPENPFALEYGRASQLGYLGDVSQLNIPKVLIPPIEPHHTDMDKFYIELQNQFRDDLLFTTKRIWTIKQKYTRQQVDFVNYLIIEYFNNVHAKLQKLQFEHDIEYSEFIDYEQVAANKVNYVFYGHRFWDWCVESQLYTDDMLRNYSILLYKILLIYPREMLKLYHSLCISSNLLRILSKSEFDFKIATYEPEDDPWKIYNFIKRHEKFTFEDGSLCYKNTFPTFPRFKNFFLAELKRCLNFREYEREFAVELKISEFGFHAKDGECFNWNFSFKLIDAHFSTYSTYNELTLLILAISASRKHFAVNYGILFDIGLNSVTLRFDSSFYEGCEHFEFASFRIFAHVSSLSYEVFAFLSELENFGVFMGHLFYWAHQNSLLDGTLFAFDYEFACMILFYLEQQQPAYDKAPFPTISKLNDEYCLLDGFDGDMSGIWKNQNFVAKLNADYFDGDGRIENWMIFGFFEFYHNFDFSTHVICPYDGVAREKENYQLTYKCKLSRWICVAGVYPGIFPSPNEACTEERMQQFKLLIERMYLVLKDRNQPEMFYIEALTNPKYFLNSEHLSDESKACGVEAEVPDLTSDGELDDPELVPENLIESVSDLFADLSVNETIVNLNQNVVETFTENDPNEISLDESGIDGEHSNTEQSIGNQTGPNEEDNSAPW